MKVICYSDEQEDQEIVVENEAGMPLFRAHQDHDCDGWQGMETAREIAEGIAKALGIPYETAYKEF